MKIGSILENLNFEKRVAITPEIAKKFIDKGFEVNIQKNYAAHIGFKDEEYRAVNANILETEKLVIEKSEILAQLGLPTKSILENISSNKTLVGVLNPYQNKTELDRLVEKK